MHMPFEFHGEPVDILEQTGGYCQQIGKLYEYKLGQLRKIVQQIDDEALRKNVQKEINALSFVARELDQLGMQAQHQVYMKTYPHKP